MPRTRKAKGNRDGITVRDQWARPNLPRAGKRWLYRVWHPTEGKYRAQTFADGPADADRRTPGCAAGDAWALDIQAKFRLGLDSATDSPTATLVDEYVKELRAGDLHDHHVREVERVLGSLVASGATDMRAPTFPGQVAEWRRTLRAIERNEPKAGQEVGQRRRAKVFALSPVTANRYLGHVRALVKFALASGRLHRDPLAHLKRKPEPDTIKATFAVAELRALVALRDYGNLAWTWAVLMAFTGMRAQEAAHLRWQDIDRAAGQVHVRRQPGVYDLKGKKERTVPLQGGLGVVLDAHPDGADLGHILPAPFRSMDNKTRSKALTAVLKAAGVELGERTPHSFRHSYAAMMVATHANALAICSAMGHTDLKITAHYAREAAKYRATIEAEGWKPGELRLVVAAKSKEA